MRNPELCLAVIGAADCDDRLGALAFEVGREIAARGAVLVCGGRGGVMAEAARGAIAGGGRTVGILPGRDAAQSRPSPFLDLAIYTGLGQARNQVVVLTAAAAIAIGGGWGTLSEIGLALKHGVPVVLLDSWTLDRPDGRPEPGLLGADSPSTAVERALEAAIAAGRTPPEAAAPPLREAT